MTLLRRLIEVGTQDTPGQDDFIRNRHVRFANSVSLIVCVFIVQNAGVALYFHQPRLLPMYLVHFIGIALVPLFNHLGRQVLASAWFGGVAIAFVSLYSLLFGVESVNFVFLPMIVVLQFFMFSMTNWR